MGYKKEKRRQMEKAIKDVLYREFKFSNSHLCDPDKVQLTGMTNCINCSFFIRHKKPTVECVGQCEWIRDISIKHIMEINLCEYWVHGFE